MAEHIIAFQTQKTYSTLNNLSEKTEYIWFVCHGLGYLSRYFIKYFSGLDASKNYIIAPQAPSKYYQDASFKNIGACWLTREETELEINNIMYYFNQIYHKEIKPHSTKKLIVMGYSQGVSVAMRWVAKSKINCHKLLIHSGSIPEELTFDDFRDNPLKPYLIYGTKDHYISRERAIVEENKAFKLFGEKLSLETFEGKHEVSRKIIKSIVADPNE